MATKKTTTKKKATKKKATKKTAAKKPETVETQAEDLTGLARNAVDPEDPQTKDLTRFTSPHPEQMTPEFAKFELAKRIAHSLANSSLVPEAYRGRPNDCFVAINMGREVGLEPFAAIQSIAVIDGKPCLYGDGLIGVVRASPLCEWIKETISDDGMTATCTAKRKGDPNEVRAVYTWDDAIKASITHKNNWKKHPKRMLQMRARAYCLRDAFPDLLKGLGVVEEMVDHETTPVAVTDYALPDTTPAAMPETPTTAPQADEPPEDTGPGIDWEEQRQIIEEHMGSAKTMAELLRAAEMAKAVPEPQASTLRVTYQRCRKQLLGDGAS